MEKALGVSGLVLLTSCFICCTSSLSSVRTFYKYSIGQDLAIDSMHLVIQDNSYYLNGKSMEIRFSEYGNDETMFIDIDGCSSESELNLIRGEEVDLGCDGIYPIIGRKVSVLDVKSFQLTETKYTIYKLFNESGDSYLNSSTTFWLIGYGVILIKLSGGKYFEVKGLNSDLLQLLKDDLDFSELWPIPELPLPPEN